MNKKKLFIYVAAGIILIAAIMTLPFQVGSVVGEVAYQTVPSRTSTPEGGPQPTNTSQPPPPPTDDPGGGGQPQPTATTQTGSTPSGGGPTATATPTTAVTAVIITPEGGYEATAEPCGLPPTVQARGTVNVRLGPGLEYEPVANMIFLEVRPIIGRAEFATWWLIQLPDNETGWVANQAVTVQGYTGLVPIVEPPEIDGATPTPGPLWEPTPNPVCTPQPTATPTEEPTVEEAVSTTSSVSNATRSAAGTNQYPHRRTYRASTERHAYLPTGSVGHPDRTTGQPGCRHAHLWRRQRK